MAKRPVFIPTNNPDNLVEERLVEFKWHGGFAPVQKQKNITALHEAAKVEQISPLLEISTKSAEPLGKRLSAFNLKIKTKQGEIISLESAYQGSKVFANGNQYDDIYEMEPREAKQYINSKEAGELAHFDYFGEKWELEPKTAFYNWLYLTALHPHQDYLIKHLGDKYKGFTDIEFNPDKSFNCQAHACALLVSLINLQQLDKALHSPQNFIAIAYPDSSKTKHYKKPMQENLFRTA